MDRLIVCFTSAALAPSPMGKWRLVSSAANNASAQQGDFNTIEQLAKLATDFAEHRIEVYLPGEYCPSYWVHLPKKKRDAIASIPYQIEPLLSEPLEQFHLTPLLTMGDTNQHYPVWTCQKKWLEQWMDYLEGLDFRADSIAPDYTLLWQTKGFSFSNGLLQLSIAERVLVAGKVNASGRSEFIQHLLMHGQRQQANDSEENGAVPPLVDLNLETLELSSKYTLANLLSGSYKQKPQTTNRLHYIAAGVAGVGLLLNLVLGYIQQTELAAQKQSLKAQVENVFNTTLPQTRMVDPLYQLQQEHRQRSLAMQTPELLRVLNLFSGQLGERHQRPLSTIEYSQTEQSARITYQGTALSSMNGSDEFRVKAAEKKGGQHSVDVIW